MGQQGVEAALGRRACATRRGRKVEATHVQIIRYEGDRPVVTRIHSQTRVDETEGTNEKCVG